MWLVTPILDSAYVNIFPSQAAISLLYHDGLMDTGIDCVPCSLGQWATTLCFEFIYSYLML